MSLAFQRLLGEGTVAKMQLDKMQEIVNKLGDLSSKFITPDIKAVAKMLYPDKTLNPVYKTFSFAGSASSAGTPNSFQGRFFGVWFIGLILETQPGSNNETSRIRFLQNDNGELVYAAGLRIHGDDIYTINSHNGTYIGGGTDWLLKAEQMGAVDVTLSVVFHGFEVKDAENGGGTPAADYFKTELANGNVYKSTYADFLASHQNPSIQLGSLTPGEIITLNIPNGKTLDNSMKFYAAYTYDIIRQVYFTSPGFSQVEIPQGNYDIAYFTEKAPPSFAFQVKSSAKKLDLYHFTPDTGLNFIKKLPPEENFVSDTIGDKLVQFANNYVLAQNGLNDLPSFTRVTKYDTPYDIEDLYFGDDNFDPYQDKFLGFWSDGSEKWRFNNPSASPYNIRVVRQGITLIDVNTDTVGAEIDFNYSGNLMDAKLEFYPKVNPL